MESNNSSNLPKKNESQLQRFAIVRDPPICSWDLRSIPQEALEKLKVAALGDHTKFLVFDPTTATDCFLNLDQIPTDIFFKLFGYNMNSTSFFPADNPTGASSYCCPAGTGGAGGCYDQEYCACSQGMICCSNTVPPQNNFCLPGPWGPGQCYSTIYGSCQKRTVLSEWITTLCRWLLPSSSLLLYQWSCQLLIHSFILFIQ